MDQTQSIMISSLGKYFRAHDKRPLRKQDQIKCLAWDCIIVYFYCSDVLCFKVIYDTVAASILSHLVLAVELLFLRASAYTDHFEQFVFKAS